MNSRHIRALTLLTCAILLGMLGTRRGLAQGDCPAWAETALLIAAESCAATEAGAWCYGHGDIQIETEETGAIFAEPGDQISASMIDALTLSPLTRDAETWGIVIASLTGGDAFGPALTIAGFGDMTLTFADESGEAPVFAIRTDEAVPACIGAPPGGLLVKSDGGRFVVNAIAVELNGAAFIQSPPGQALRLHVLSGEADVATDLASEPILAGSVFVLPSEAAAGSIEPFDEAALAFLPLNLVETAKMCVATARGSANRRGGPGTRYLIKGALAAGERVTIDGQAEGADGILWWRLADATWVRSDLLETPPECQMVASVTPREAPSAAQAGSGTPDVLYYMNACMPGSGTLRPGATIQFYLGGGGWRTRAEAQAALTGLRGSVTVDGAALTPFFTTLKWGENNYGVSIRANWTAVSSVHTVSATFNLFGETSNTCTLSVP